MRCAFFLLSLLLPLAARAQMPADGIEGGSSSDSVWTIQLSPVVVMATRSAKELVDVAVPTTVVAADEMRVQGALRL